MLTVMSLRAVPVLLASALLLMSLPTLAKVSESYLYRYLSHDRDIVLMGQTLRLNLIGDRVIEDPARSEHLTLSDVPLPADRFEVTGGPGRMVGCCNLVVEGTGRIDVVGYDLEGNSYPASLFAIDHQLQSYAPAHQTTFKVGEAVKVGVVLVDILNHPFQLPDDFFQVAVSSEEVVVIPTGESNRFLLASPGRVGLAALLNYVNELGPSSLVVDLGEVEVLPLPEEQAASLTLYLRWPDRDGSPLPFQRVGFALSGVGKTLASGGLRTDRQGDLKIPQLAPGSYLISAEYEGEEGSYRWLMEVELKPGDKREIFMTKENAKLYISGSVE